MAIGARLRQAREQQQLSLEDISRVTRVQPRVLAALEDESYSRLPPRTYTRGMVRAFAREVGLDPDDTARDYVAAMDAAQAPVSAEHTPPAPIEPATPSFRPAAVGLAALLTIAAVVAWNLPVNESEPGPQAVGTAGFGEPVSAASPPPGAPADTASSPGSADELSVVLEATRRSWVAASADGARVIYRILQPGERETLRATREIALRVGDAGAVTWAVNGKRRGTMGESGEVRDVTVSRENASSVR